MILNETLEIFSENLNSKLAYRILSDVRLLFGNAYFNIYL